jgi:hypothetical protein
LHGGGIYRLASRVFQAVALKIAGIDVLMAARRCAGESFR